MTIRFSIVRGAVAAGVVATASAALAQAAVQSADLLKLRSVSAVEVSPDATRVAYIVENNDGAGRPYGQLWVMTIADGKTVRFGADKDSSGNPEWSPDSQWIAYRGRVGDKSGLVVAKPDGSGARWLAELSGTNAPLPGSGRTIAWAPDGKRIVFVSSVAGPETADATGDPIVITRYLYKPDAAEGMTRFNDNRRLHLFMVDVASGRVEQLTDGAFYEHSVDWSPNGQEIAFLTNRDADHDEFFNYDVFVMKLADKSIRRLSATESNEYHPRWSPDGKMLAFQATKRGLTDRETTMEDTHAWVVNADGASRREIHDRQSTGPARMDAGWPRAAVHGAGARQRAFVSPADRGGQTRAGGGRSRNRQRLLDVQNSAGLHARDALRSGAVVHRRPQDDRSQRGRAARQTARRRRIVHVRLE